MDRSTFLFPRSSSAELLLTAVEKNDLFTIDDIVAKNPEIIHHVYELMSNKTIIQIAVSNFAKTALLDTVKLLIKLGADLYFSNEVNFNKRTIHYASLGQNPAILSLILQHLTEGRVNDLTTKGETALHLLIREGDPTSRDFNMCLEVLLGSDIDINIADNSNSTPIVIAVQKKYKEVVMNLLNSGKNVDVDNYGYRGKTIRALIEEWNLYGRKIPSKRNFGRNVDEELEMFLKCLNEEGFLNHPRISSIDVNYCSEQTYLQIACERNLKLVFKYLLEREADIYKVTLLDRRTPLGIAGFNGHYEIFGELLPRYTSIPDDVLVTLLQNPFYKPSADSDREICLRLLLSQDTKIAVNSYTNGNTPLHYAVKYSDCQTIMNLLKRGASLGNINVDGILPVEDINPKTLERHLDNCITTKNIYDRDKQSAVVIFDYTTLFPSSGCREVKKVDIDINTNDLSKCRYESVERTENINDLSESYCKELVSEMGVVLAMTKNSDLRYLLNHPVIYNLISLKCHIMQTFFHVNFFFYLLFVLSLIAYIFFENNNSFISLIHYVLFTIYFIFIFRECTQFWIGPTIYVKDFENYLELFMLFFTGYVIFAADKTDLLYKQISSLAILLSAMEIMLLMGQYPLFSTYISVFKTVSWNFFKFILWSSVLLVAFTLSFFKTFHKPQTNANAESGNEETVFFAEPTLSFIKVFVMLTGEFDASSLDLGAPLSRVLFLLFVFLVTITLFNVLNGLAVSDIQAIKETAEIVSLIESVNRIVFIEKIFSSNTVLSKILLFLNRRRDDDLENGATTNRMLRKIFLFPFGDKKTQVIMGYDRGKLSVKMNTSRMYMNSKMVECTKEILFRNQNEEKTRTQHHLDTIKNSLQGLLEKPSEQWDINQLNTYFILNSLASRLK